MRVSIIKFPVLSFKGFSGDIFSLSRKNKSWQKDLAVFQVNFQERIKLVLWNVESKSYDSNVSGPGT